MRVRFDAGREPDDEIAEVRWVPLSDAPGALSYKHDRGVVAAFAKLPRITAEVWLIRHARAGTQHAWHGPDRLRPLDAVGHEQVARLTGALSAVPPDRLVSATPLRCRETLASLAELLGLPVKVDGAFDEDAPDGLGGGGRRRGGAARRRRRRTRRLGRGLAGRRLGGRRLGRARGLGGRRLGGLGRRRLGGLGRGGLLRRRGRLLRRRLGDLAAGDLLLEALARPERRYRGLLHFHRLAGARISRGACGPHTLLEDTEAGDRHPVALGHRRLDLGEYRVERRRRRLLVSQTGRERVNELSLVHNYPPEHNGALSGRTRPFCAHGMPCDGKAQTSRRKKSLCRNGNSPGRTRIRGSSGVCGSGDDRLEGGAPD